MVKIMGLLDLRAHGSEASGLRLTYGGFQALSIIVVSTWLIDLKLAELTLVLTCLDRILQCVQFLAQETGSLSMT